MQNSPIARLKPGRSVVVASLVLGFLASACAGGSVASSADDEAGVGEAAALSSSTMPASSTLVESTPTTSAPTTSAPTTVAPTTTTAAPDLACEPIPEGHSFVELSPVWNLGVVRDLQLTMIKERSDSSRSDGKSVTPVRVEVVGADNGVATIHWSHGDSDVYVDGVRVPSALLGPLRNVVSQFDFRYRLDTDGTWLGLDNVDELRESFGEFFLELSAGSEQAESESMAQVLATFESMSDEAFGALMAEDAMVYHFFDQTWFERDEVFEVPDELPNPFGGESFPAISSLTVKEFADEDGCVLIEQVTTLDPVEAERILLVTMQEVFGFDEGEELPGEFEITNTITAQYDYGTGFFHSVLAEQRISMDGESSYEASRLDDVTE